MKQHVFNGEVPRCGEKDCGGLVKPDIVFFGEALPKAFDRNACQTTMADLVLIIETSLSVYPFAGLPEMKTQGKPRVLFNMERMLERLWREVVGEKEAERQLGNQTEAEERLEDEMEKLAAEVESVMVFGDDGNYNDAKVDEGHVSRMVNILDDSKQAKLPEVGDTKEDGKKVEKGEAKGDVRQQESISSPSVPLHSNEAAPKEQEDLQTDDTEKAEEGTRGTNQTSKPATD
ncbi:DHS-like NAD/FAD-binding domain-containing protein [Ilyonectria destructans]|nr:DHS-like NAD/FAD-binding domain-containing protein [Ilyonectria destructans]